ncbi:MAG TPA: thioredoxin family protein [Saprospiraceae bacterium]|nr:thioredoxin family protein [Saprospiraceae bacterium]
MKSLVFAAFVLAGVLTLFSATAPSGYVVGDKADDFSLKNVDGNFVSLSDYTDVKGFIVVFTCNHCPYAQMYEERIIALHNKYKPKGFPVIAINPNSPAIVPDDSYEEMQKRAKEMKYPFPYLFDEQQTVFPKFGATRTPHVFIIDTSRVVRYIGAIDDNPEIATLAKNRYVENALEALLRGETPKPDYTLAIGCTVKKKPK